MNLKHSTRCVSLATLLVCIVLVQGYWKTPEEGPTCKFDTCRESDATCECSLTIDHRLTMTTKDQLLVVPSDGKLYYYNDTSRLNPLSDSVISDIITTDGYGSRLVIAINDKFPGPTIEAYENQQMIIHVRNLMHTDSTTLHFHGMHQRGTPHADGVAFISQCPILPGQTFTHRFTASPHGSSFYHAHIGDQRTMGLYGGLIIYPRDKFFSQPQVGFTVLLQDWNHNDEPETLYQRMLNGIYNFQNNPPTRIETTQSVDGANFSRFHFHSGLINGKGRFYSRSPYVLQHNGAPLEIFRVKPQTNNRFRVISAATLYPFRVYVQDHPEITIVASDGFEIVKGIGEESQAITVESFIIHPGERFDFLLYTGKTVNSYLLVAESIEVLPSNVYEYHAAEAIIEYEASPYPYVRSRESNQKYCTSGAPCVTFNCPYLYYPANEYRQCLPYDVANSNESNSRYSEVDIVSETLFFNFAFPGEPGNTPGSVNGRAFVPPVAPILTESSKELRTECDDSKCRHDSICSCTYSVNLDFGKVYQFVMTNLGSGRGWSHPVHLHGHYFFVYKMGFGEYDQTTAKFIDETDDIECMKTSTTNYCNSAKWRNQAWDSNIPGSKTIFPPEKDTIIIPTGGYVVIRFKANNPGAWFFHCHIDLHNTNGMGMVLLEASNNYPSAPSGFPKCGFFGESQNGNPSIRPSQNGNPSIRSSQNGNPSIRSSHVIDLVLLSSVTIGRFMGRMYM
ncbi:uncharacterized protein LOC125657356 [Ostrea edulis]|uniref:uncharacterized protein LOC125657356 n=1 Tax=Ostrea edulis TaxID=37623 RepID=UPI0024AF5F75|nr:uncharacterized protein LOC125657356 [Ostrea edulis]XP_056004122.1 uncharacterized protein LOC125657356 [Ostrea edulis]